MAPVNFHDIFKSHNITVLYPKYHSRSRPLSDIPIFYIKYLTMHKARMHVGAIRQLLYGCAYVREIMTLRSDNFEGHGSLLCDILLKIGANT